MTETVARVMISDFCLVRGHDKRNRKTIVIGIRKEVFRKMKFPEPLKKEMLEVPIVANTCISELSQTRAQLNTWEGVREKWEHPTLNQDACCMHQQRFISFNSVPMHVDVCDQLQPVCRSLHTSTTIHARGSTLSLHCVLPTVAGTH